MGIPVYSAENGHPVRVFSYSSGGFEVIQFIERAWPVCAKQTGECAIGEEASFGLARGAIVCFVCGVTDALDFGSTSRTGLLVFPVNSHLGSEGGHFFGELAAGLLAENFRPAS